MTAMKRRRVSVYDGVKRPGSLSAGSMVATDFGQNSDKGFWTNLIYRSAIGLAKLPVLRRNYSVEHRTATNIYLATSDQVKGISGRYFGNSKERRPYARYDSVEKKRDLWRYCAAYATKVGVTALE
ncbi:MAG: hypothetical protein LKI93_02820 [Bifidobacteriaceae bacterium]|nr:hypothetical protein [Bifidobacteriaceae bacterium]